MVATSWISRLQFFLTFSSATARTEVLQIFNVSAWLMFLKLKVFRNSWFFCMILISMTENSIVSWLVDVFKIITKVSNFYVTTNTFATSTTSLLLFKAFWCTTFDTFLSKVGILKGNFVTCSEHVKHIYPKNVYQPRLTDCEKTR